VADGQMNANAPLTPPDHLYMSVGLGWFVLDVSSTGFVWTERLCEIISEHLI
jgi:hypothetical protein